MNSMTLVILSAAALAMAGAIFGVLLARTFFADDLRHAESLRKIWDRTESSMARSIEAQNGTIKILKRRLGED